MEKGVREKEEVWNFTCSPSAHLCQPPQEQLGPPGVLCSTRSHLLGACEKRRISGSTQDLLNENLAAICVHLGV